MNATSLARQLLDDEDDDFLAYLDRSPRIVRTVEYQDESGTITVDPEQTIDFDCGWLDAEQRAVDMLSRFLAENIEDNSTYTTRWVGTWGRYRRTRRVFRLVEFTPEEEQRIRAKVDEYFATHI